MDRIELENGIRACMSGKPITPEQLGAEDLLSLLGTPPAATRLIVPDATTAFRRRVIAALAEHVRTSHVSADRGTRTRCLAGRQLDTAAPSAERQAHHKPARLAAGRGSTGDLSAAAALLG